LASPSRQFFCCRHSDNFCLLYSIWQWSAYSKRVREGASVYCTRKAILHIEAVLMVSSLRSNRPVGGAGHKTISFPNPRWSFLRCLFSFFLFSLRAWRQLSRTVVKVKMSGKRCMLLDKNTVLIRQQFTWDTS
jgi:hypothetical protein